MSIASRFIANFRQSELSGKLFLQSNFNYLSYKPGLYLIRNPIDPNRLRFKIGMMTNMINRLNAYFTYFPTWLEIFFTCSMKSYLGKTSMLKHESDLWQYIINASE